MLFVCDECNCVDDTDLLPANIVVPATGVMLCSHCCSVVVDGKTVSGEWHGIFPRETYDPDLDRVSNRGNGEGVLSMG